MGRVRLSVWMLGITLLLGAVLLLSPRIGGLLDEPPAQVVLTEVTLGSIEQVVAVTGRVRYASEYAALSPQAGIVAQVYVSPGQQVTAGQPLFRLEGRIQEALLSKLISAGSTMQDAAPDNTAMQTVSSQAWQTLNEASAVLASLTVRAPADGLVHQVSVVEHGGVQAGSAAVMLSCGNQQIVCPVVMTDAVKLREGMQARLSIRDTTLCMATVTAIGALETDLETGQTIAQIRLTPEKPLSLPLGATVDADVILCDQQDVPVVPLEALSETGTVWWTADGRCYEIDAGVVLADDLNAWVALPVGLPVAIGENLTEGKRCREVQR